ncbi:uncharacterized protein LOC111070518 [Drosophila obscura]|uniref:uncharacterized protein LOC111070518 n=1 Tax=Drosophila obscura TaxID=7282 RepID=UPI001BB29718|nr:uncharacterized protein LOC111070518 [Drosophila obscura]
MFQTGRHFWPFRPTNPQHRRRFVVKVYLQFVLFLLMGLFHWIFMITVLDTWTVWLVRKHSAALILAFVVGIFLFLLFSLSRQMRNLCFLNWLTTLVIVEFMVQPLALLIVDTDLLYLLAGFLIVSLVVVIFTLLAAIMPCDLTEGGIFFLILFMSVFVLSVYCVVFYEVIGLDWSYYIFAFLFTMMVVAFLMYHVQCIMGGRSTEAELADDKYAALLLFYEFVALFMLTLYWRPQMDHVPTMTTWNPLNWSQLIN